MRAYRGEIHYNKDEGETHTRFGLHVEDQVEAVPRVVDDVEGHHAEVRHVGSRTLLDLHAEGLQRVVVALVQPLQGGTGVWA